MLKTIIALSFVLACGFLLVILSCALWNNFLPLVPTTFFLLAPLPNAIARKLAGGEDYIVDNDGGDGSATASIDFAHWVTGFMLTSALGMPAQLAHVGLVTTPAAVMGVLGGALIYGSIVVYGRFFSNTREDF